MMHMPPARRRPIPGDVAAAWIAAIFILCVASPLFAQSTSDCLACHDDKTLKSESGKFVGVPAEWFKASVHASLDCTDCHTAPGNYDDIPHYAHYTPVDCSTCHEGAVHSFDITPHAKARASGNKNAPTCASCHGIGGSPHRLRALDARTAESACKTCHTEEVTKYDKGVHAAAVRAEKKGPGCVTCHQSHGPGLLPAADAVSELCSTCHPDAPASLERGGHLDMGPKAGKRINCASCHAVHDTEKPESSPRIAKACTDCHQKERDAFAGSVHADMIADGDMTCVSCHSVHVGPDEKVSLDAGCASCHEDEEAAYRGSVHRLGRMRGAHAASCADCHGGHHILAADDPSSPVNPKNIAQTCGSCHTGEPVITSTFVRLPVSLPSYLESVHAQGYADTAHVNKRWNGGRPATCTDCHGSHNLRSAEDPQSSINRLHIANTCGHCHNDIAQKYLTSIHGKAVMLGIKDAPTCTDCHDEHLIKKPTNPSARTNPEHVARELCGTCHTNADLIARYGVERGVVGSYLDSYHGWAIDRGSKLAATCIDCHTTHAIMSPLNPASSVNPENVTHTCSKCHPDANPTFARSYTHASALAARRPHEYVRMAYIALIILVLGGMAAHNVIVGRYEFGKVLERRRREPYVQRWWRAERVQHMVLLLSFFGLAITGFALRYPDAWWVKVLGISGHEGVRANLHRSFAVILMAAAAYHVAWVLVTRRGRKAMGEMAPRIWDVRNLVENMAFYLGARRERPRFRAFDYTQKAEYWALVWGTIVMALSGLVLWFPTVATSWLPAWVVRVSEVVHFYEAILAVSAIFIWHFFYVLLMPGEYPMSTVWLDGHTPAHEWKEMHRAEYEQTGDSVVQPPVEEGVDMVTHGRTDDEPEGPT